MADEVAAAVLGDLMRQTLDNTLAFLSSRSGELYATCQKHSGN